MSEKHEICFLHTAKSRLDFSKRLSVFLQLFLKILYWTRKDPPSICANVILLKQKPKNFFLDYYYYPFQGSWMLLNIAKASLIDGVSLNGSSFAGGSGSITCLRVLSGEGF